MRVSKTLSYFLRHAPNLARVGVHMDAAGYVPIADLLKLPQFRGVSEQVIMEVVRTCPKQRFAVTPLVPSIPSPSAPSSAHASEGGPAQGAVLCIRANQGHDPHMGVQEEQLLTRIGPEEAADLDTVVHGTFQVCLPAILRGGLSRMQRQHVHFATSFQAQESVSGLRRGVEVVIAIHLARAIADGIPFFMSSNGVVLTPGEGASGLLPPRYFAAVYRVLKGGQLERMTEREVKEWEAAPK